MNNLGSTQDHQGSVQIPTKAENPIKSSLSAYAIGF